MTEMEKKYPLIYHRHWSRVHAHFEGAIAHDGDCGIWRLFKICTCGLHHELMMIPDDAEKIYPKYWDEQEGMSKIDMLMDIEAHGGGLWVNCDECEGGGKALFNECKMCSGKGVIPFKMPGPPTEEELEKLIDELQKTLERSKRKRTKDD